MGCSHGGRLWAGSMQAVTAMASPLISYRLDTCVISELVAQRPDRQVVAWGDKVDDALLYLSAITIGEIARGIEKLPESTQRATLRT